MKTIISILLTVVTGALVAGVLGTEPAVAGEDTAFDFYGYVKADAIYDFKRINPEWNSTLRPSQIPIPDPDDVAQSYEDGEMIFSVKSTRLGTDIIKKTTSHDIIGKVEFDFYGTGTNTGHFLPRLRHASITYGQLLVGQAWSLFSAPDASPLQLDFWGPNGLMLGRRPQIRWTPVSNDGGSFAVALEKPGAGVDAGKGPSIDPQFNARTRSIIPDFSAMYRFKGDWGFVQIAGLVRDLGYEGNTSTEAFSGSEFGGGGNIHGHVNTGARNALLFQIASGAGIANYGNDGGHDISGDGQGNAKALGFTGWSLGYDAWWNDRWTTGVVYSQATQDNSEGQLDDAFKRGSYAALNLVYHPEDQLLYGLEFIWGELEVKDGRNNDDYRLQFSAKYSF